MNAIEMKKLYILLGGNVGDTQHFFYQSKILIQKRIGNIVKCSSVYVSEAWGFSASQNFLNQVLLVETKHSPEKCLELSQEMETELGRTEKSHLGKYSSRTIDIDLLLFENEIIETKNLNIPHPRMHLRKFTLLPLAELNASLIHPVIKKSIRKLLEECPDNSKVQLFSPLSS